METQNLKVIARREVAHSIIEWTLADPTGRLLPGCRAGAHIDVYVTPGVVRAYSLVQPSGGALTPSYVIAVALDPKSRGGSAYLHQHLRAGDSLQVGLPRNHFPLADSDAPALFVAGGIGVTPLLAMARERAASGRTVRMVFAARSRAHAAYLQELQSISGELITHFDAEHGGRPLDVPALFRGLDRATHIYCCGPQPLMDAVRECARSVSHPQSHLHFESFTGAAALAEGDHGFVIRLSSSGREIEVPPDQSILDALENAGVIVPSVCHEGNCGTCECTVLEGEVDHRDQILSDDERLANRSMMICVSRARGERLVLEL